MGGAALLQVDDPDEVIDHIPDACAGCGADLADAVEAGVVRRQVHDISTITRPWLSVGCTDAAAAAGM